jgi:NRAMP (natural resistance-associated macrophage protein)-like metal ion transporter
MKPLREYWKILGPGLTTGAADDDPSGIATYSQIGAQSGFGLIWLALFSYPMMGVVQEMCARIGLATGAGLATNIKRHYSKKVLFLCTSLLVIANVFNIGANLGAMAESTKLVFPSINFLFLVIVFALISLVLQIFVSYKGYAKYLKYLALTLFAYVASALLININWLDVMRHLVVPNFSLSGDILILICAALGTTISPYLFFWQTDQEVEEQIAKGEATETQRRVSTSEVDIKKMRIDVWSGMFISNLVMFFIIAASAATLFQNGITNIATASDAALALKPFAGDFAYVLFTLGILGTGFLSIPVLAGSASYAVSESFGWKYGLYRKLKQALAFYGVIISAVFVGIILNFVGLDPIKTLIYSAILNGLIAPIVLFLIVHISSSDKIMGQFKNTKSSKIFGFLIAGIMAVVAVIAIVFLLL